MVDWLDEIVLVWDVVAVALWVDVPDVVCDDVRVNVAVVVRVALAVVEKDVDAQVPRVVDPDEVTVDVCDVESVDVALDVTVVVTVVSLHVLNWPDRYRSTTEVSIRALWSQSVESARYEPSRHRTSPGVPELLLFAQGSVYSRMTSLIDVFVSEQESGTSK